MRQTRSLLASFRCKVRSLIPGLDAILVMEQVPSGSVFRRIRRTCSVVLCGLPHRGQGGLGMTFDNARKRRVRRNQRAGYRRVIDLKRIDVRREPWKNAKNANVLGRIQWSAGMN